LLARVAGHPLVRGGLTIMAGVLTGNALGVLRVGLTAYLLGTHSRADSLAVAMGPIDTLNSALTNSMVFAFVPLLTACAGGERVALFRKLTRGFLWVFSGITLSILLAAPWLMRALAPGLAEPYFGNAVQLLRILSLSTLFAGSAAVYWALLYTDRRFGLAACYQAALNVFTIAGALCLWKSLGVYAFALGYTAGAGAQLAAVYFATRRQLQTAAAAPVALRFRDILSKPAFFIVYASGLALNVTFTRAYATHAGSGMAAALDYCMRGVGVPMALLVSPISNSLLPEIARLRSLARMRDALRLIDRTVALTALAAVGGCGFAILFRYPAIALFFQRGSFTAESTRLVAAVFLGMGPSLVGWTLLEIMSRSLFALNRPWPPVIASTIPLLLNVTLTLRIHSHRPELIGLGSSVGLLAGFAALFAMAHTERRRWLKQG
jgi:putative peptidoglycan lipid II flippase